MFMVTKSVNQLNTRIESSLVRCQFHLQDSAWGDHESMIWYIPFTISAQKFFHKWRQVGTLAMFVASDRFHLIRSHGATTMRWASVCAGEEGAVVRLFLAQQCWRHRNKPDQEQQNWWMYSEVLELLSETACNSATSLSSLLPEKKVNNISYPLQLCAVTL